jgi:hypothetical protein
MQICHIDSNSFYTLDVVEKYYEEQITKLAEGVLCEIFNNTYVSANKSIKGKLEYPEDCLLNCAVSDKWVIAHKKNPLFKNSNKSFIGVNQGYAKCSTVCVSDNAIITADPSVYDCAIKNGISALKVRPSFVKLDGYDTGFLGGASGSTESEVLFCGDLDTHPDAESIRAFCAEHKRCAVSLGKGALYDYGTLTVLCEI